MRLRYHSTTHISTIKQKERPFQVTYDDETRMGQGHAALFLRVGADTGATYIFGLVQVSDFFPLRECWRVAGAGDY